MTTAQTAHAPTTVRSPWLARPALALAGALFIAYPAIRPYADETTLAGAEAMASTSWLVSHLLGMAAFIVLALALSSSAARRGARSSSLATGQSVVAATAAWAAALLALPYYGAETFGLQVIARRAVSTGDASLLELAEEFRMGAVPVTLFGLGLVALAVAGLVVATSSWRASWPGQLGGVLAGAGLILYLPQFFAPPALRITHGVVLGIGLLLLALTSRSLTSRAGTLPTAMDPAGA